MTRKTASRVTLPTVTLMVAFVSAATRCVVMKNFALIAPAGTMTDAGTIATPSLLDGRIPIPLAGAGAISVTVPSLPAPAFTVTGVTENCDTVTGGVLGAVGVAPHAHAQRMMRTGRTAQKRRAGGITG
jgi:hypothetical protein